MNASEPNCSASCSTARSTGTCSSAGCVTPAGVAQHSVLGVRPDIWSKIKDHPCYSEQAHHYFARMHLAVAPACNIQCHYCNRKFDCSNESRPGVTSAKLTPEQALHRVRAIAARMPQLSVVGIAGPGDALANPEATFRTLDLVHAAFPDLRLCLSTNGLALPEYAERVAAAGVDHVTITINAIDPEVATRIYPWIFFRHKRRHGMEAARLLLERQLEGLQRLAAVGVLVKINSVMIPGINDEHLREVNRVMKAHGAFVHNIMPLISDPAHGTHFGLSAQRGPTTRELEALRIRCAGGARMMRHCRQCRADAAGLLGEDVSHGLSDAAPATDAAARAAYRELVEHERAMAHAEYSVRRTAAARAHSGTASPKITVAVASRGSGRINRHFGQADEFLIYEVSAAGVKFIGSRKVPDYCADGEVDEEAAPAVLRALEGCGAVFASKFGPCSRRDLRAANVEAVDDYAHQYLEASLSRWYAKCAPRNLEAAVHAA